MFINGKFLAQSLTGVQRYATELLQAFDALLVDGYWRVPGPVVLLVPSRRVQPLPLLRRIHIREIHSGNLHVWEQFQLPWAARSATLINLAGSAPLGKFGQICTFHDTAVFDVPASFSANFVRWYRLLFHVQGRLSRRVLTVSDFSKERLIHHLGIDAAKVSVIHCGADHMRRWPSEPAVLANLGVKSGAYFLAVGSTNPNKNFARLIEAFAGLPDPDARLIVVGGSNATVFADSSDAARGDSRIVRAGRLIDSDIKALYSHARAYVFPSIYEGFGLPPVEAMFCNCPVLASRAASIPEICGSGAAFFDPNSVDDIRASMQRAMHDDGWLDGLRRAGAARAENFTWQNAALSLARTLAELGLMEPPGPERPLAAPIT